jgi:hypothetical protein
MVALCEIRMCSLLFADKTSLLGHEGVSVAIVILVVD